MSEIEALAAVVRAGLDADEEVAGRLWDTNQPGRRRWADMQGTTVLMTAWRARREIKARRAMLDALLAEPHAIPYGPCPMSAPTEWEPHERRCTCGRDARVAAYLTLLARPYQEEER